jgi:hypothetical protein
MESDFTKLLLDLVRQAEPDLDSRLESQSEALNELVCTHPTLGQWIAENDVQYLLAAFDLDDQDFAENFPGMAHIKEHDRKRIIETFETHLSNCLFCHRKRSYDLEFTSRIEAVCRQNKGQLLNQLQQEHAEPVSEEDHGREATVTGQTRRAQSECVSDNAHEVKETAALAAHH